MADKKNLNHYAASTRLLYADKGLSDEWSSSPPIHQSVSGISKDAEEFSEISSTPMEERFYTRYGNPTNARLAKVIANLEGGEAGVAFASGQGAMTTALMTFLKAGDHVVAQKNHYNGNIQNGFAIITKIWC